MCEWMRGYERLDGRTEREQRLQTKKNEEAALLIINAGRVCAWLLDSEALVAMKCAFHIA
jgi:hypothetical protein